MSARQIPVTIDEAQLSLLDKLVSSGRFASRDDALREAVAELTFRFSHERLVRESEKLDPDEEVRLADEGLGGDAAQWPEY
jgi:Arc/MetJ-type ribon-helix-helix transcriptional regulator